VSKRGRAIEVKVGLLVVVCLLMLVGFLFLLGDFTFGEERTVVVDFDTSAGLKVGAAVKVAGIPAGRVESIDFQGGKMDTKVGRPVYVRITLSVNPDKADVLKKDAEFYITTEGVLGEKYVEIDPGRSSEKLGDTIKLGVPPMRIEVMAKNLNTFLVHGARLLENNEQAIADTMKDIRLAAKAGKEIAVDGKKFVAESRVALGRLTEKAEKLMGSFDATLVEFRPGKGETGNTIKSVLTRADHILASIDKAIGDGQPIREILVKVKVVLQIVRVLAERIGGKAIGVLSRVDTLAREAQTFIKAARTDVLALTSKVGTVLKDVTIIMKHLKDGDGTIGALLHDREMYDDIREMMKDLKRHPWKFLWKE
jgi:phospholipid/cholesterol/gamma-HCH transport system substrate-binding protein